MKRPSPSMAVALTALVFAMTGTGIAAKHYLITSSNQIAPGVLRALRGKEGPPGQSAYGYNPLPSGLQPVEILGQKGATGETGARGLEGPRGERGKEGGELPWARYCTALGEVVRDLEFTDQELKAHLPPPVGPTGLIDRQEAALQAKEITAAAVNQIRALSNCGTV